MPRFTSCPIRTRRAASVGRWLWWIGWLLAWGNLDAADPRPVVGPGATKEEVLDAYGWPTGQSQAGAKEILTYPQGRVVLENGRVEAVDFSLKTPWPPPRPRPGALGTGESWFTGWPEAQREAQRRRVRILALFVGSDWSPPSKQFLVEVADSADFFTAFLGSFVLVKLDFPTRAAQVKALRDQNVELRERYEVTTYPAVVLVNPDGSLATKVDLNKPQPGDSYRAQVIAAVREARDALAPVAGATAMAPVKPKGAVTGSEPAVAPGEARAGATTGVNAGAGSAASAMLSTAGSALAWGLGGGSVLVLLLLWSFWRSKARVAPNVSTAAERVADAASGLPSPGEMAEWSHLRLRGVMGVVAEADGYEVAPRPGGAEGDLALTRTGESQPSAIVSCAAASAGQVSAKRLRELFGTITLESVSTGWFVAMGGFSSEARDYAQQHGLVLISRDGLREQLRSLTERDLQRALSRGG